MGKFKGSRKRSRRSSMIKKPAKRHRASLPSKNKRKIKQITKKVKKLKMLADAGTAQSTYKEATSGRMVIINPGEIDTTDIAGIGVTQMDTALAKLRFYDSSTNTFDTVNISTMTQEKDIFVKSVWSELTIRNNYATAAKVKVYVLRPKHGMTTTPNQAFTNGLLNQQVVLGSGDSPTTEWSDVELCKNLFKTIKVKTRTLEHGQQFTVSHGERNIKFNAPVSDSTLDLFRPDLKNFIFWVRLEGTPSHGDNDPTLVGQARAGIDYISKRKVVVEYDAGIDLNDYNYATSLDTPADLHQNHIQGGVTHTQFAS